MCSIITSSTRPSFFFVQPTTVLLNDDFTSHRQELWDEATKEDSDEET